MESLSFIYVIHCCITLAVYPLELGE